MVFQSRLEFVKKDVEQALVSFFATKRQEAKKISPHCLMLVDGVAEFTMRGGKRTRAFLCWLGAQTATDNKQKAVNTSLTQAMMGIELFQSFALIHDDIIDEDTTRRGGPTVHEFFKEKGKRKKVNGQNNKHFGDSMAILAGDLALVWADELMGEAARLSLRAERSNLSIREIATSPTAPRNDMNIWNLYQRMKEEVIFGQSLDVMKEHMKVGIPKKLIDTYKTAWYSVIRPLQIGAAIGGADEKLMESFVPYGLAVGQGYQLRDDFLDGVMSEEEFQKSVKKLVIPKSATILLTNFARFAITRQS